MRSSQSVCDVVHYNADDFVELAYKYKQFFHILAKCDQQSSQLMSFFLRNSISPSQPNSSSQQQRQATMNKICKVFFAVIIARIASQLSTENILKISEAR